jgi:hypothetical protein
MKKIYFSNAFIQNGRRIIILEISLEILLIKDKLLVKR